MIMERLFYGHEKNGADKIICIFTFFPEVCLVTSDIFRSDVAWSINCKSEAMSNAYAKTTVFNILPQKHQPPKNHRDSIFIKISLCRKLNGPLLYWENNLAWNHFSALDEFKTVPVPKGIWSSNIT